MALYTSHIIYPGEEIPEAYFSTRYATLRQPIGMSEGSERLTDDYEAIHCFLSHGEQIISVGRLHLIPETSDGAAKDHDGPDATLIPSFSPLTTDDTSNRPAVQIRQMGTLESFRNRGCARKVLDILEHEGKTYFGAKVGFLQAREKALNFYQKSGWSIIDDPYEIGKIGLHRSMIKRF